ncbi:MAG: hypothetical protein ABJB22_03450 [Verrucomicrobiota bacterium]
MFFKRRMLLLLLLVLLLAGAALVLFSPVILPGGIRLLARWQAGRQGLKITIERINAPLFRPIELSGVRVVSQPGCAFQIDLRIPHAEIDLDLRSVLTGSRDRALRRLAVHDFTGSIHHTTNSGSAGCRFDWGMLHRLLPDEMVISNASLRLENGALQVDIRGLDLSASEIAAGRILARDVRINAPFFHQEFPNLRGAASWENDRLTVGAIELMRGIDLESVTADFARLKLRQVGVEMSLDAFGGKLRTSISIENQNDATTWTVAGTGSAISLAQVSDAVQLATPARGSVRASKFTFRGDPRDISHATASIWAEVTGLTWRDRTAETIMLGASLYSRHIQVEQLYVKQLRNEFTLTGEYLLPEKSSDWLSPDFQGDISASISDLGDFARLFGGEGSDFAGVLSIRGTVNERDRKIGGRLTIDGESLRLFRAPVEMMSATVSLQSSEVKVEKLEAVRGNDYLRVQGNLDLAGKHKYSGIISGYAEKIADYTAMLPTYWQQLQPDGALTFIWSASGNSSAHSGDLHVQLQHLQIGTRFDLAPFDAVVHGIYSPESFFFRQFQLSNEHAALSAFVTVAGNYLQLQTLRFDLNGKPALQGDAFLPLQFSNLIRTGDFFGSMDASQNFEVDVSLAATDLAEFSAALTGRQDLSGTLVGKLEAYGALGSFQLSSDVVLQNLAVAKDPAHVSGEFHARTAVGALKLQSRVLAPGSDAITFAADLPLLSKPQETPTHAFLARDQPAAGTLDFPLVMIARLPRFLRRDDFAVGILSGKLAFSHTLQNPEFSGDAQLIEGRFRDHRGGSLAVSGRVALTASSAAIEYLNLRSGGAEGSARFRGEAHFANFEEISVRLIPDTLVANLVHPAQDACIDGLIFFPIGRRERSSAEPENNIEIYPELSEADLRGGVSSKRWTLTLTERSRDNFLDSEKKIKTETKTVYHLCLGEPSRGSSLQLGLPNLPGSDIAHDALTKFRNGR